MKHLRRAVVVLVTSAILQRIAAVNLRATTAYDDSTCATLGSISVVPGVCSSNITCPSGSSGTGVICMTDSNYKAQIAAAFSVKAVPYVTISTFSAGSCSPANLVTAMTYAADGLCHPMANATATSFRVTIYNISSYAGNSEPVAAIATYSTSECSGGATSNRTLYTSDLTTNSGCSGLTQTELSLDWPQEVIPMTLKATTAFDSADCYKPLGSLSITPQTCTSSSDFCTSGVGSACTSFVKYKTKVAAAFGTVPYIAVWTYSGSVCTLLTLVRVQVYAADSQCHPIGSKFFKVTIRADLTTSIANYSDAGCTTADGEVLVTAQKLITACDNQAQAHRYEVSANYPVAVVKTLVYFDGLDCGKTVGSIQMTTTSSTCTATVCSNGFKTFCSTNTNYETTVATAFGMIPYITVSKFSGNACTAATLVSAISYVADGQCHPLGDGKYYSVATQSTNEQIMTIRKYTDTGCSNSDNSDISVTKALLTTSLGCDGAQQATQYKVSGTVQQSSGVALRVVSAFDDGDCTKTLGSVIISPGSCTTSESSCLAGTWTTCTTNYNYETALAAAFKTARYVVVSVFWGSTCSWMTLESATAYAGDGNCHLLGMKYFKVAVDNGNAVISTYTDPSCTTLENAKTISVTTTSGCNSGTKMRLTLSPNWFTRMDVAGVYATVSCTGTPSKLVLTDSVSSTCSKTCSAYNLSDCTSNSTYKSYLDTAFGTVPYLIMEAYTGSNCRTRSSITAYAADGSCYVDGSKSFTVTPVAGNMVITTFTQQSCTGSPSATTVTNSSLLSNLCVSSENVKYYMGGNWQFTTSTLYDSDDSKCALTPSKFSLTLTAKCTIPTAPCKSSTGYDTVFVAPGCTKASSYMTTIDKAFGMTPYAVQETYATSGCIGLTDVTAYVADGLCHLGADATSSYRVTWNPTSVPAALIIETFSYGGCFSGAITPTIVGSASIGGACVSDTKKVYVGGLTSKLTAITTYSDSACTSPVQVVFSSLATTCITQSKCTPAANGLYMNQGCATDYEEFLSRLFESTVRLVTDIYEANYTSNCAVRQGIVAYVGDGVCHLNIDGTTSFKVTLGKTESDSTWLATYSDGNCNKGASSLEITPELLAAGSCDGATNMKFIVSAGETPTPTPATAGSGTSSATSFLSVPAFGLMTTVGGVIGGILMLF